MNINKNIKKRVTEIAVIVVIPAFCFLHVTVFRRTGKLLFPKRERKNPQT